MGPRAVADTNVWVAAAIAPHGVCGRLLHAAIGGKWEPVASPLLIEELADVLARRKFRRWLTVDEAERFIAALSVIADVQPDPPPGAVAVTADPDDDYLVVLARAVEGVIALISGDPHLTDLVDVQPPVMTPAAFLAALATG